MPCSIASALDRIMTSADFDIVVISSNFSVVHLPLTTSDGPFEVPTDERLQLLVERMQQGVALLTAAGKRPVVVSTTPRTGKDLGRCLRNVLLYGADEAACDFHLEQERSRTNLLVDNLLTEMSEFVPVVRLSEVICPQGVCDTLVEGVPIYRDSGHLSVRGSRWLGRQGNLMGRITEAADGFYGQENGS